ncbi:molecular chaperone Hsp33 [Sphingomonas zeicaulis]|uniref:Hsp33 family molecular chaperone HslO n=1 Tax=Sphingomonas zeicaulis TaxID=1632740 RepID=UPI003D1BACAA
MTDTPTLDLDRALGFAILSRSVRGRLVRIGPALEDILAAHNYPLPIEKLLGEALVLTALLGAMLKDDQGQLTMQAQTENGVIDLLVADYRAGELRGYVRFDAERLAEMPVDPSLFALFGKGYLAITFDQSASNERYQGIVPLEGASLCEAVSDYFERSEQIPSLIRAHIERIEGVGCVAGGMLLQHLPEGEEGGERLHVREDDAAWEHVSVIGGTVKGEELVDPALPLETLIWRLFNEDEAEVRVLSAAQLAKGCRCDPDHIAEVLLKFPDEERAEMADANGVIAVNCEFCSRTFPIPLERPA